MITIVTVTYNAGKTIERTLKSVAMQTYKDYEHLIIDGASTDCTVDIASEYDTVIVSEPDKGLYDAMNKGIRLAKGEWIVFLNAGDKLHSVDTLQHIAEKTTLPASGIIYGDTDIVDDEGVKIRNRRLVPPLQLTWRSFREGMLVCHQSFYINKEIAQMYDLGYRFSADFDWCIRCMKEGEKRGLRNIYLREPLTDYLSEGMTTANHKASLKERFWIMSKHYGFMDSMLCHAWFVVRAIIKK